MSATADPIVASMAGGNTLQARELAIGYGRRRVAAGISLQVQPGEVYCLLGPNGCGKTTLFRTLLGLIPPLAGSVQLAGRDLARRSRRSIARLIAYVPQSHAPAFPYTVREVVLMGRTAHLGLFSQPRRTDHERAGMALEQLGIADLADADYSRISGGQRQLVLLARALAGECAYLVMDEPTASLDYGNQALVLQRIRVLAASGIGVVMSSHDPDHVLAVGDRAALMRDGAILRQGPVHEVMDSATLGRVYGIAVDVITLPDGRKVCLPGRPDGLAPCTNIAPTTTEVSVLLDESTRPGSATAPDLAASYPRHGVPQATIDQGRIDLAAALRWAARLQLNEGVCNHFSLELAPDRYLINPQGLHWSEVQASDILLIDGAGQVIDGRHTLEPTAFFIHSWIHRLNSHARCVLHTHMPYATALTLVESGRLEWCNQNTLRFWNRVGYDDDYRGLALDESEGRRIAGALKGKDVLFSASHGVTVVAASVAWAFDDLYYLERACMHQVLAVQAANGRPLRRVPDAMCEQVGRQIAGERQQSDMFFDSIKRILSREEPGWDSLSGPLPGPLSDPLSGPASAR